MKNNLEQEIIRLNKIIQLQMEIIKNLSENNRSVYYYPFTPNVTTTPYTTWTSGASDIGDNIRFTGSTSGYVQTVGNPTQSPLGDSNGS